MSRKHNTKHLYRGQSNYSGAGLKVTMLSLEDLRRKQRCKRNDDHNRLICGCNQND
jgi:hypothetical protein